ncbi:MAG: SdrD B-like domain-containing protein [Anaerolineaceae bacterium]|nr:SdrD B-like domain-containing protein [Anaerolineaceae bacterium]
MTKKALPIVSLLLASVIWLAVAIPVFAQPGSQSAVINTPTPGTDGRILYKVQKKDTCLSISLLMGISLDKLRQLNNLKPECVIMEGQDLLLGKIDPNTATPTYGPSPTATPILPSATPFNGTAQVCVLLYHDINGDAMRQEEEPAIPDGAVSMTDRLGKVSLTLTTAAGSDSVCFKDVPEGEYNISVAVPQGYNPTTAMNYALTVKAGDQSTLDFGAQPNSQSVPVAPADGGRSPLLGILGGLLLLGGIGLGLYVRRAGK